MPNKSASTRYRAPTLGAAVLVAGLLAMPSLAQDAPETEPASTPNPDVTADGDSATPPATPLPGSEPQESPHGSVSGARPSLDYEPTEAISEDRSVSFPVDI